MNARRLLAPLVIVVAVGGGAVAGALIGIPGRSGAQESSTTTTTTTENAPPKAERHMRAGGPEFEAAAKALGMSVSDLMDKLSDGKTTIADVAQQQGVDLKKVTDAMVEADRERIDDFVHEPLPKLHAPDGDFKGPGRFGFGIGRFGDDVEALAKILNLSVDQLRTQLREGKSLADIAKAQGVDPQKVIDQLVTDANAKIDAAVKDGRLTQAKADDIKAALKDKITEMVNGQMPKFWKDMHGLHGLRGDAPTPPEAPTPSAAPARAWIELPAL